MPEEQQQSQTQFIACPVCAGTGKRKAGFTLVELLVVIAIIGLLATMTITYVNFAKLRARDTKRLHNITQVQKAIELYYDDNNHYPPWHAGYNKDDDDQTPGWPDFVSSIEPYLPGGFPEDIGHICYDACLNHLGGKDCTDLSGGYCLTELFITSAFDSYEKNDQGDYNYLYEIGADCSLPGSWWND